MEAPIQGEVRSCPHSKAIPSVVSRLCVRFRGTCEPYRAFSSSLL